MNDYTKFSIRVEEKTRELVENFAESHGMSRNAAVEFLLKLSINSMQRNSEIDMRFDHLEEKLKGVYQSLVKQGIYQRLGQPIDESRNQEAADLAAQAVNKIFED